MTVEGSKLVYEIPDENSLAEYLSSTLIPTDAVLLSCLIGARASFFARTDRWYWDDEVLAPVPQCPGITRNGSPIWRRICATPPIIEELLGFSGSPRPELLEKAASLLGSYLSGLPAVGLASSAGTAPPTLRVTSALHAAYIITLTRHVHPKTNQSRHTTMNEYDLRPYFPDPYNTDRSAVGVYFVPLPFRADLPTSFSDLADGLKRSYRMGFSEDRELLKVVGSFTRAMAQFLQTEFQANLIGTSALVSNLGVVENHVQRSFGGAVSVLDFSFTVEVVIGMSALHFYTFRDWLRYVHSVDEMFEGPSQIGLYLEEMERVLREELLDGGSTAANQD
ncbi:uncharacterized protein BJX67DRAFT_382314 [Aspergillus lucknowensis]|uniref:Uncharacterized protein n=1 Tax=Aspergillus lucknowensis TaxID=176173 RepID=A0ABR4LN22_9EURO